LSIYKYKAFGINFASEVELPELLPYDGQQDIDIVLTEKIQLQEGESKTRILSAGKDEISFEIFPVGRCSVIKGSKIIIEPDVRVSASTLRLFILTSAFGCLFYQRKLVPIHGSAIVSENKSIILMGNSGAGKSTLTSAFLNKGYDFLTDDVSIINRTLSGIFEVQPGYPYRKLKIDSLKFFSFDEHNLERIEYEEDKYLVPASKYFREEPAPVYAMIEIVPAEVEDTSIIEVNGIKKLQTVYENVYRISLMRLFNLEEYFFGKLSEIASNVKVYQIIRPYKDYTCDKQIKLIQDLVL